MTVLEDVLNDAAGFAGATRVDLWAPGLRDNSVGTGGVTPQVYSATVGEGGALLTEDIDPGHYKYRVAFNRFIPSQEGELIVPDSETPVRFVPLATEFISYTPPVVSEAVTARDAAEGFAEAAQAAAETTVSTAAYKQFARNPDTLIAGSITRDSNGAATSAPVVWPDGTVGTYTALAVSSAFPGAVDSYKITYGSPVTLTFTQPTVTRDSTSGAVTLCPAIGVS